MISRKWSAYCQEDGCYYRLFNRGQIGTEAFAIRHAKRKNHEVHIFGPNQHLQIIPVRDMIEPSDQPPF